LHNVPQAEKDTCGEFMSWYFKLPCVIGVLCNVTFCVWYKKKEIFRVMWTYSMKNLYVGLNMVLESASKLTPPLSCYLLLFHHLSKNKWFCCFKGWELGASFSFCLKRINLMCLMISLTHAFTFLIYIYTSIYI
jgi:hypothetical protein